MPKNNNNIPAKWTVMIYMAANDDTSNAASLDFRKELLWIGEMLDNMGDKAEVNILLQIYVDWDLTESSADYRAKLFIIQAAFENNTPQKILDNNVSMGTSKTLTDFINFCKTEYPAEKYLLLLWGHGTGSGMFDSQIENTHRKILENFPDFTMTNKSNGQPVTIKDVLNGQNTLFINGSKKAEIKIRYVNEENKAVTDLITIRKTPIRRFRNRYKYFLHSDNPETLEKLRSYSPSKPNLDGLIGRELNKSLKDSFGMNGKLDLLVIMGCCMQMVELGYEIREHCKYYAASEELMFFEGYNYFDTFSELVKNPDMKAIELGKLFITDTPRKEEPDTGKIVFSEGDRKEIAIACVDLEKNHRVAGEINLIAGEIVKNFDALKLQLRNARSRCSHFGETAYEHSFIDIIWFFKKLHQNLITNEIHKSLVNKIEKSIQYIENEYILKTYIGDDCGKQSKEEPSPGGHGVAIYFPKSKRDHINDEELGRYFNKGQKEYVNTFSTENEWNDLIVKYMELVP